MTKRKRPGRTATFLPLTAAQHAVIATASPGKRGQMVTSIYVDVDIERVRHELQAAPIRRMSTCRESPETIEQTSKFVNTAFACMQTAPGLFKATEQELLAAYTGPVFSGGPCGDIQLNREDDNDD